MEKRLTKPTIDTNQTYRRRIPHKERNTAISSNCVIHFTPKFNSLLGILENGFRPSFCNESPVYLKEYEELRVLFRFMDIGLPDISDVEIPMVCFCDIPLKRSYYHRKCYGIYGIALKKSWAFSNWITPVTYIAENTKNHSLLYRMNNNANSAISFHSSDGCNTEINPYLESLQNNLKDFLEYVKPYYDQKLHRKYYDEREWRYIPESYSHDDFKDTTRYLKFDFEDIQEIIVKNARQKREVRKYIKEWYQIDARRFIKVRKFKKL